MTPRPMRPVGSRSGAPPVSSSRSRRRGIASGPDLGDFCGTLLESFGDFYQIVCLLAQRGSFGATGLVKGPSRRSDRPSHVLGLRLGDLEEELLCTRVDDIELVRGGGLYPISADEEAVVGTQSSFGGLGDAHGAPLATLSWTLGVSKVRQSPLAVWFWDSHQHAFRAMERVGVSDNLQFTG
jgi:hypothetical protein